MEGFYQTISLIVGNGTNTSAGVSSSSIGPFDPRVNQSGGLDSNEKDHDYSRVFEFIAVGIGIPVVTVLGLIGNLISACVLSRTSMKSSISCLLLGLTLSDSILILCSLLLFGLPVLFTFLELIESNSYMQSFYPAWGPKVYALAIIAQTCSIYFTIAVTVERYLVVCSPLKSRYLLTWKRTKVCSASIFIFSVLYNLPRWWELEPVADVIGNRTLSSADMASGVTSKVILTYKLDFTQFRSNPYYIQFYINWSYLIIMCLFPFTILVTLNVLIYLTIRRSNESRHGIIASVPHRDYSFALVLFCVTATFLVCNTLAFVINLLELWKIINYDLENLSNFLVTLNSSVNCGIYCAFGNKFREQLFQMRDEVRTSVRNLISNVSRKIPRPFRTKSTN